ncbi:AEC family transporter [Solihabitans fulvus]|uniref:AEC family transporter n=1 Tax=Solihabitans fulvus TaxID=1892852 RepID=A0A5B2XKS4_9PSEU|nr:AEC family transporter [Solihabitans fulvus]KAA2263481.1 AEC family transporter [Solihabitans fulvus]
MGNGSILGTVIPLFALVLVGYAASYFPAFESVATSQAINNFVFWVALPALLFSSVATADLSAGIPWSFVLANLLAIAVIYVFGFLFSRAAFRRDAPTGLVTGMLAGYGNVAYLGVPLLVGTQGAAAALPVALGQLIHNLSFMISYPAVAAVLSARAAGPGAARTTTLTRDITRSVVLNPVTLSVAAGLVFAILRIGLPGPLAHTTQLLGGAAAPGALFTLGLTLRRAVAAFRDGSVRVSEVGLTVGVKLVAMPLLALLLVTFVIHLPPIWAYTTVVLCGLPNAVTAYVLAQQSKVAVQQAAAAVVFSTLGSVLTLSVLTGLLAHT